MKLIVLYGPENSGKTTTLKMVYDELKNVNALETNQFNYIDKEPKVGTSSLKGVDVCRLDYRDILLIDKSKLSKNINASDSATIVEYMECCSDEFPECIQKVDKEMERYNGLTETEQDSITVSDCNRYCEVKKLESVAEYIKKVNLIDPQNIQSVGIVTQGDYGYRCKSSAKNLYQLLDNLKSCDTIICACSHNSQNPILCVKDFVLRNAAKITTIVIVFAFRFRLREPKNSKTRKELRRANIILRNV